MAKCQEAVPGWIMPINRALESLNPKQNRFDIIIIDEASQSDISSLAILYMGRKLIIVGDDKQVSPMAVGVEIDKMNALEQMYIKDKIPNSHLYNAKTSIYDIAATTFQPLMLREHFRCVSRKSSASVQDEDTSSQGNDLETIAAALGTTESTSVLAEPMTKRILPEDKVIQEQPQISTPSAKVTENVKAVSAKPIPKASASHVSKQPIKRPQSKSAVPDQLVMSGMEDNSSPNEDILSFLKKQGVKFVDKRQFNGALWIIGGHELNEVVNKAKALGCRFVYKADGGKATKSEPGWWTK